VRFARLDEDICLAALRPYWLGRHRSWGAACAAGSIRAPDLVGAWRIVHIGPAVRFSVISHPVTLCTTERDDCRIAGPGFTRQSYQTSGIPGRLS
jgi:hypothetical protein